MTYSGNRQFLLTSILTIILSSIGFALLHFSLLGYGYTFFILVPLCIGYFLGKKPSWKTSSTFALLVGLVAFFYLLITTQLEGLFCVVTLLPLIIVLVFLGAWLGWGIREVLKNKETANKDLKLSIYPLFILLFSGTIEHYFTEKYDYGKVESKIVLPYPKEVVFDYIKSVDTLDTDKPFLLHLGLSVPQKCSLEKEEVGANRICYFKEGTIEEKVTEIKRGEILKMDVTKYGLPGRKWLKFQEATYLFEAKDNGTSLTRISTYRSELKPRFYWRFWEEKAIAAEHEYVLNDLRRRLEKREQ
jgi:hypothetical protein